jgi:hypothetical protein
MMSTVKTKVTGRDSDSLTYADYIAEYAPLEVGEEDSECEDRDEATAEKMAVKSLNILREALAEK